MQLPARRRSLRPLSRHARARSRAPTWLTLGRRDAQGRVRGKREMYGEKEEDVGTVDGAQYICSQLSQATIKPVMC